MTLDQGYRTLVRRGAGESNRAGDITYPPEGHTERKSPCRGTSGQEENRHLNYKGPTYPFGPFTLKTGKK